MLRGAADSPGQAAEAGLTGKLGGVMSGEVALRNCPDGPAGLARFAGAKFGGG